MNAAAAVQRMAVLAALALALVGCGSEGPLAPATPRVVQPLDKVKLDVAYATSWLNRYRASKGLGPVRLDPALTGMAQQQADAMAAGDTLSHDAAGRFAARLAAVDLDPSWAGENIGGGYYSTQEAFAGWQASSEHNANMLKPEATRFGIALAKKAQTHYRAYWALELAGERASQPAGGPFAMSQPPPAR